MNKEEILAMEAGAKLDALVHVKVMGKHHPEPLHYSTDIAIAWGVVDKMVAKYGDFVLDWDNDYNGGKWSVVIDRLRAAALAKTAPEAICKAALVAELKEES